MRRFASIFVSRRDRPDAPSTASNESSQPRQPKGPGVLASLARRATQTSIPPLLPSNLTNSSSSSSSGSTALQTPIDENLPHKSGKKGSWASWIAPKKQARREAWFSCSPPIAALSPPNVDLGNETVDARSSPSDDGSDHSESQSSEMVRVRANTRIILWNSLVHRLDSPPLLDLPEFVAFPRSSNPCRSLRRKETLESKVHKNALLSRLNKLSPSELSSITAWSTSVVAAKKPSRDSLHDFFPEARAIARHSEGLRTWVSRPYYEERVYVWTQEEKGEITCSRVTGPQLGVAALEYSEVLDILSGPLPEPPDKPSDGAIFDPTFELLSLPSCIPGLNPPAVQTSPLKTLSRSLESSPPSPMTSAPLPASVISETMTSDTRANPSGLVPKKGVRFAEDDGKDDKIPLGYMLRVRKNKEQKAKFLRQERERRAIAQTELASQEEERARREIEKLEMDKLRRAREQERKQLEEQERQQNYMEEVQATRIRREAARSGQRLSPTASHTRPLERDYGSESRDSARPSMRRDSSSRGSELVVPVMNVPSYDASPASSLPPTPGSQHSFSRPPSVYSARTASSEDVRNREARRISRRNSTVSDPSKHAAFQVPYNPGASLMAFNPSWGMIPPVPPVPAIPSMPAVPLFNTTPFYGMEMPLLPPTAPFMMDQYRSRSPGSRTSSPSRDPSRHQLCQTLRSDGSSSRSRFSTHGTQSNSVQRRSIDGLSPATASGKLPLERSIHSQYDLRSPPSYPNSSRTDLRRQAGAYPEPRTSSPRRASTTPSHTSQSHRRIS